MLPYTAPLFEIGSETFLEAWNAGHPLLMLLIALWIEGTLGGWMGRQLGGSIVGMFGSGASLLLAKAEAVLFEVSCDLVVWIVGISKPELYGTLGRGVVCELLCRW